MSPTSYTLTPGTGESSNSRSNSNSHSPPGPPLQHHHQRQLQPKPSPNYHLLNHDDNEQQADSTKAHSQAGSVNNDKSQRSRDGCLTCRARKVKCNEIRPVCDKCRIKNRECLWPSGDESERRRNKKRRPNSINNNSYNDGANSNSDNPSSSTGNGIAYNRNKHKPSTPIPKPLRPPSIRQFSNTHTHTHAHLHSPSLPMILPHPHTHTNTHAHPHIKLPPILPHPHRQSSDRSSLTLNPNNLKHTHPPPLAAPSPSSFTQHRLRHQHRQQQQQQQQHHHAASSLRSPVPASRIRGVVHIPPGFLPPDADMMDGRAKGKDKNDGLDGDLVDYLMPEKVRAALMMDPSFLEPYFPTVDERLVIRHYLSKTVHIIIAFESNHRPWNPWIRTHAPLAFRHLPGSNPAADALRSAILAVGGVHLTYSTDPTDQAAAWRITKSAKTKVLKLIKQTLEDENGRPRVLEQGNIELILAALLSCTIASSLAADDSWHHLLSSVLSLIDQLGGAQNILQDAPRDRLSPYRFFMEQLAIRDVFGCMTTELAPSILKDAFTPWFFEAESWSRTDPEWESVERMFGISRGMVDMIARACYLIASVRSINTHLPEIASPSLDPSLVALHKASSELMSELKVWDEAENFTPLHPRTQYGNHSYKHAIRIRMLRKVYNIPSEDERVVGSSQAIIELAGEMLALYGKITWLTWPILIAGFEIPPSHPSRRTALEMLGAFGPHACFDNRAAARMLSDYWMWHDMDGDHATSWEVARTLNQRPFLD
ncbi:uncharacterized protein I303_108589 [Kwoniella dejecticola CBS 10117]|uniref:Zn(2)-C6 fungal-type domain-containing protein n=1 Tax=Kwoniella dejecticola CBS 10117 TaxID=1296121 RepID=A0AAJ8KWY0_9TREE